MSGREGILDVSNSQIEIEDDCDECVRMFGKCEKKIYMENV